MAAPNRRTIDEKFNQDTYYQSGWGVQNAQLNKMITGGKAGQAANSPNFPKRKFQNKSLNQYSTPAMAANTNQTLTSRPSEDGRRKRTTARRYQGRNETTPLEEESRNNQLVQQRYYNNVDQQPSIQQSYQSGKQKVRVTAFARARGITFGTTVSGIAIFLWPWQVLFATMGAILWGMSTQVEESWLLWLADKVVANIGWVVGFEYSDLGGLAFAMGAILAIIASPLILGSLIMAKIMGLHPLFGNGTLAKTGLFLLAVLSCFVPIFPITVLWAQAVAVHPK